MSESPASVVIVGGGLAGFTTAQALRNGGFSGPVTIIDPEGTPYDRPPLSKAYLSGDLPAEGLGLVPADWFAAQDVTVCSATATAIDPDAGTVTCADGTTHRADAIVLALGGRPRVLPVPGGDLPGLHRLRTRADADALRAELAPGRHLCIIGAGLIGAEVAATAVAAGATVTLVDPVAVPLVPVVGAELAARLQAMHGEHGVTVVAGGTGSITRTDDGYVVTAVPTDGGDDVQIGADAVLVAIGIVPNTQLAERAGLEVDDGILVGADQRSSHPRVWAVGDVARVRTEDGMLQRRHEHWESAMQAGQTAAASILGADLPAHGAGWMWSDRYGHHVAAVGDLTGADPVIRHVDGTPGAVFGLRPDGTMAGAASIDDPMTIRAARRIIDRGIVVDRDKLADPAIPLKKLMR